MAVEGLFDVQALRRNPGDLYDQHEGNRKLTNSTDPEPPVKFAPGRGRREPGRRKCLRGFGILEPADVPRGLVSEPGHLALGEAHRRGHDRRLGLVGRKLAAEHGQRLTVSNRGQRSRRGLAEAGQEPKHFRQQPALQHLARAGHDGRAQRGAVRAEADQELRALERGAPLLLLLGRDRAAGQQVDLERADDPDAVPSVSACRGRGIEALEQPVEPRVAEAGRDPLQAGPQRLVAGRSFEQPLQQRPQVEAGPPRHDRKPPARPDPRDRRARQARVVGGGEAGVRLDDVDQVVRHARPLRGRRLGAADVEPAVDLEAVAGDDLARVLAGEAQRERALAGGGRSDDRDQRRGHSRHSTSSSSAASSRTAPRT